VQKGEIEGRVDPNFVSISKILEGKLQHSSFRIMNFGKCISYIQYGISKLANTEQKGIPIIRMNNLKGDEWDFSDIKHIELLETEAEKYKILNGDLLFNRTNSKELVGKCGVFRYPGNWVFASYLIRVRVNESLILPNFASFFLSSTIGRLQIDCLSRQIIGMTNINAEEIKLIKIPVPPLEIQAQIVAKFEAAYAQKRAKEAEAKTLLAGIDEYLLNALGIRLPEPTEKKKFFYVRANQVSGGRLDAFYHQSEFEELEKALRNGHYELINFKELIIDLKNGIEIRNYVESGFRYLRVTDLDKHSINDTNKRFVDVAEIPDKIKLNKNCILVARSGSLGLISIVTDELLNSILSSHIFKIELNINLVKPEYLELYFRSILGQKQFFRKNNGGVIPEINQNALKSILVSLPPLAVQAEIANHITEIRTKAKRLEQEAKEIIERAKQEVEAMILGS